MERRVFRSGQLIWKAQNMSARGRGAGLRKGTGVSGETQGESHLPAKESPEARREA